VKTFTPPVIRRDSETFNGRGGVHHLTDFFVEGHLFNEVIGPLFKRQRRIQPCLFLRFVGGG
jgi:hypothetical protein